MIEEDIDDTHLCIKCNTTIVGLDNYVQHRKTNCSKKPSTDPHPPETGPIDQFRNFDFTESTTFHKSEEVEKANKSLTDTYDIPYDLGADVFFSSLELQSSSRKPVSNPSTVSTGGKHGTGGKVLTRKATAALMSQNEEWISSGHSTDSLMKVVRDISGTKKCDSERYIITFPHDSPDPSEEEDDDDDDYEAGGPPSTHTGGKWKPGNTLSPNILRGSPAWDEPERSQWDAADDDKTSKAQENDDFDHDFIPPPGHTKGKWVPGTKIVKLDYKEEVEVEKIFSDQYWCNTCNRKLATKLLYERHVKSSLHLKRSQPEQELEQARTSIPKFSERIKMRSVYLNDEVYLTDNQALQDETTETGDNVKKKCRNRRKYFIKCDTCKKRLRKDVLGKHLISHYHYRQMSRDPTKSFEVILKHMDKIVLQAPYQCRPCRFYANTHDYFMNHWNSREHADIVEGPGRFCCNFCKFECEDNNQMRRHLLGQDHNEVILAVNRSYPIVIGKRIQIECPKCKQTFRFNIELRKHAMHCTREPVGTASDDYQSKFFCPVCKESCKSQLALQKHQRKLHKSPTFFCSICKIEFNEASEAKKHRSTALHRVTVATLKNSKDLSRKCHDCGELLQNLLDLKSHLQTMHPDSKHLCAYCGETFVLAQELSRHNRGKQCQSSNSVSTLKLKTEFPTSVDEVKAEKKLEEFTCDKCDYKSPLKADLLFHKIIHDYPQANINTQLPCSECGKNFRKYSLRYHLRQHTEEKVFECKMCSMKFSRKYNLKAHEDNVHKTKNKEEKESKTQCQCDVCGKCLSNKYRLRQHIETIHEEVDKKFECNIDQCIYAARSASDLKIHLITHTNERIFQCESEGCHYKGKSLSLLKRHSKMHQPPSKVYNCPQCNFQAKISGHLKRHLRIHTGEKPYKCPYCTFQCNTSENLRKHVLTTTLHIGRYLYECQHCGPTDFFKTNFHKDYRRHLITAHREKF